MSPTSHNGLEKTPRSTAISLYPVSTISEYSHYPSLTLTDVSSSEAPTGTAASQNTASEESPRGLPSRHAEVAPSQRTSVFTVHPPTGPERSGESVFARRHDYWSVTRLHAQVGHSSWVRLTEEVLEKRKQDQAKRAARRTR